jgi:hypothetical protein
LGVKGFGISQAAAQSSGTQEFFPLSHRLLLPQSAARDLARAYAPLIMEDIRPHLARAIELKHLPLKELLLFPAYTSATRTLIGRAFPAASTFTEYMIYDEATPLFYAGAPKFMVRKALDAREQFVNLLEKHIQSQPADGSALSKEVDALMKNDNWVGDFLLLRGNADRLN